MLQPPLFSTTLKNQTHLACTHAHALAYAGCQILKAESFGYWQLKDPHKTQKMIADSLVGQHTSLYKLSFWRRHALAASPSGGRSLHIQRSWISSQRQLCNYDTCLLWLLGISLASWQACRQAVLPNSFQQTSMHRIHQNTSCKERIQKQLGLERRVWGLASGLTCTSFHWFSMLSLWLVGQTCWWLEWEHKNCWQRTLFSSSGCAVESWSCKENSQDIESSRQPKEFHWCPRLAPQLVLETVSSSWPRCPACQRPSPIQYPQYRQPLIVCLWRTMHQSFQHRSMTFHDYLGSASSSPFASWVSGSSCVDWVSNMVSFKVSSNRFMWKDRGQVINFYKPRLATLIENFLNFFLSFRQL